MECFWNTWGKQSQWPSLIEITNFKKFTIMYVCVYVYVCNICWAEQNRFCYLKYLFFWPILPPLGLCCLGLLHHLPNPSHTTACMKNWKLGMIPPCSSFLTVTAVRACVCIVPIWWGVVSHLLFSMFLKRVFCLSVHGGSKLQFI